MKTAKAWHVERRMVTPEELGPWTHVGTFIYIDEAKALVSLINTLKYQWRIIPLIMSDENEWMYG